MNKNMMVTKVEGDRNEIVAIALTHTEAVDLAVTLETKGVEYQVRPWWPNEGMKVGLTWTR